MYDIELKNQTGESIVYNEIGEISIPLANKSGEGIFVACHDVKCELPDSVVNYGGEKCAFGVDYIALICPESEGLSVKESNVDVYINGTMILLSSVENQQNVATVQKEDTQIVIKIPGEIITGNIDITVEV